MVLNSSIFDSNLTRLYRNAVKFRVPTSLVIIERVNGVINYLNTFDLIKRDVRRNRPLKEIYNHYSPLNPRITPDDVVLLYYIYSVFQGGSLRDLSQETLKEINQFDADVRNKTGTRFASESSLKDYYSSWKRDIDRFLEEDKAFLNEMDAQYEELNEGIPTMLDYSGVNVSSTVINFGITFRDFPDAVPEVEDGIDIFNEMIATRYTPLIQYNDSNGVKYFRLLGNDDTVEATDLDNGSALSNVMSYTSKNNKNNTIYIILWAGKTDHTVSADPEDGLYSSELIKNATNTSFYRVIYDIEEGLVTVNIPSMVRGDQVTDKNNLLARLQIGLPTLLLGDPNDGKIRGSFDLYGVNIDVPTFLFAILFEPYYYNMLYAEERLRPYSYKRRLDIHYHEFYSNVGKEAIVNAENNQQIPLSETNIPLTFQQHVTDQDTVVLRELPDGTKEEITLKAGTDWVHVVINGGISKDMLKACINTLRVILKSYDEQYEQFNTLYTTFIPVNSLTGYNNRYYSRSAKAIESRKEFSQRKTQHRLADLKRQIPELFVDGYNKEAQDSEYLTVIGPSEIREWEAQTFVDASGKTRHRQVLPFPAKNPRYYFGCTSDKYAYPGVKDNSRLSNKSKFPYIPNCYEKDHMDPSRKTKYNQYYKDAKVESKVVKEKTQTKTDKVVIENQTAFITRSIQNTLSHYRNEENDSTGWSIVRLGSVKSPNSFLHCVCNALEDDKYLTSKNKELYVRTLRRRISDAIYPELMKQELYNLSSDQIDTLIRDNDVFLDPNLFFRAIEEYFNINIYTFGIRKFKNEHKSNNPGHIIVPRNKIFHAHAPRNDRDTILILRNWGSESDDLDYPQCELIIDYNEKGREMVKVFDGEMTELCHKLLTGVSTDITWIERSLQPSPLGVASEIDPYKNLYSTYSNTSFLGIHTDKDGRSNLVSQYIDVMGKARAFTVNYPVDRNRNTDITIVFPPAPPENAPRSSSYVRAPIDDVLKVFAESVPTAITKNVQGEVDGIWFALDDIEEGIYIPIIPTEYNRDLPLGSINPLAKVSTGNNTKRYMKLVQTLSYINSILEWLFELYRRDTFDPEVDVEDVDADAFVDKVITMTNEKVEDTANFYDFSRLPRRFPLVNTMDEGIKYLSNNIPQFRKGKFVAYSEAFERKLIQRVFDYADATAFAEPMIPDAIRDFYNMGTDFDKHPNNIVLTGQDDLDNWQSSNILETERIFEIRSKLNLDMSLPLEPRIYSGDPERIWLIQNAYDGSLEGAAAIASKWKLRRINPGSREPPLKSNNIPLHFIYIIAASGHIVPIVDNTNGSPNYINIIKYNENRYGALLPLYESEDAPRPRVKEGQVPILPFERNQSSIDVLNSVIISKLSDKPSGRRNVYSVEELRKIARDLGLKTSGDKKHLVQIIKEQLIRYGMWKEQ